MSNLPAVPVRCIEATARHVLKCFDQATTYGITLPVAWEDHAERNRQIRTYAQVLAPFSESQVAAAWKAHLMHPKRGAYMPKVADLLRYLPRVPADPETPPAPDLDAAAWEHIEEQLRRSPADRSVRALLPHQRRAFARVTGGFRSRGGFGKDEANETRNWSFLRRRFLQICSESPATPDDFLPLVEPAHPTVEYMLAAEKEHDAKQAALRAAQDACRAVTEVALPPAVARSLPNRSGGVQRPRMSEAEVARRTMDLVKFATRLEAERVAFACCQKCIMPGSRDGMEPSCAEGGRCEIEARAARGVG